MALKCSRAIKGFVIIASIVLLVIVYSSFNPEEYTIFPKCMFRQLTGLCCPACGCQRAVHQLLNGHLVSAFRYNAFLVMTLPWIFTIVLFKLYSKGRGEHISRLLLNRNIVNFYLLALITWWVCRNLSFFR